MSITIPTIVMTKNGFENSKVLKEHPTKVVTTLSEYPLKQLVKYQDGSEEYFLNGVLHRDEDQPASISVRCGLKEWFHHGKRHRINGPAYIDSKHGFRKFFVNGKAMSVQSYAMWYEFAFLKEYIDVPNEEGNPPWLDHFYLPSLSE